MDKVRRFFLIVLRAFACLVRLRSFKQSFAPLPGRNAVKRFKNTGVRALVGKIQPIRYFRNGDIEVGKQRGRVTAFTKMDIIGKRLRGEFFKLTAHVTLVVSDRTDNFLNIFRHKFFAVHIRQKRVDPFGIFRFVVLSAL